MNYDITFCEGTNCQRKEQCHRYLELLRYRADKDKNKKLYIFNVQTDRLKQMHPLLEGERRKICLATASPLASASTSDLPSALLSNS